MGTAETNKTKKKTPIEITDSSDACDNQDEVCLINTNRSKPLKTLQ
jgi:hypothetical protein